MDIESRKASSSVQHGGHHLPTDVLTLVMPSWVFLRDDLGSLLLAHGDHHAEDWLGVLLVPEDSWTPGEIAVAARYVKKNADSAAVVLKGEAPAGLVLPTVPPAAALGTLSTMLRWCPAGGTVVLAWPGPIDAGLTVLRKARQRALDPAPGLGGFAAQLST